MKAQMERMRGEMDGMKVRLSRVDELETRCASLERAVRILTREQKWEYSAPVIPAAYWADRGLDSKHVGCVLDLLGDLEGHARMMRSGKSERLMYLGPEEELEENGGALLHDDALLQHWREYANALQVNQTIHESCDLRMFNVQLSSSVIALLSPALEGKPLYNFQLENNHFEDMEEGVKFAAKCIESNRKLEVFAWVKNRMESVEDVHCMINSITSHPSVSTIYLQNCVGMSMDGYDTIVRPLLASKKSFSTIDLEGNNIRTGGRREVPDFLATNPPLRKLVLSNNHFNDNDATLIAEALKLNTNLRSLRLDQNDIGEVGRNVLWNALFDDSSLNAASDSNHSCIIEGMGFSLNKWADEREKRSKDEKILHVLALMNRRGLTVRHLDTEFQEESLNLVPMVLESLHRYFRYRLGTLYGRYDFRLSIMYEVLRAWKVPALFEKCGSSQYSVERQTTSKATSDAAFGKPKVNEGSATGADAAEKEEEEGRDRVEVEFLFSSYPTYLFPGHESPLEGKIHVSLEQDPTTGRYSVPIGETPFRAIVNERCHPDKWCCFAREFSGSFKRRQSDGTIELDPGLSLHYWAEFDQQVHERVVQYRNEAADCPQAEDYPDSPPPNNMSDFYCASDMDKWESEQGGILEFRANAALSWLEKQGSEDEGYESIYDSSNENYRRVEATYKFKLYTVLSARRPNEDDLPEHEQDRAPDWDALVCIVAARNHEKGDTWARNAVRQYRYFLELKLDGGLNDSKGFSPSKAVDDIWHAHLSFVDRYQWDLLCLTNGKEILEHKPVYLAESYLRYKDAYKEHSKRMKDKGEAVDEEFWPNPSSDMFPDTRSAGDDDYLDAGTSFCCGCG